MNTSKCGFKKLVQLNPKMINQSLLTPHADAKLGSSVVHTNFWNVTAKPSEVDADLIHPPAMFPGNKPTNQSNGHGLKI